MRVADLEIVATQDDANNVLANVVDVAFDCGHDDDASIAGLTTATLPLLFFYEGDEVGNSLLHDPGRLDDLQCSSRHAIFLQGVFWRLENGELLLLHGPNEGTKYFDHRMSSKQN